MFSKKTLILLTSIFAVSIVLMGVNAITIDITPSELNELNSNIADEAMLGGRSSSLNEGNVFGASTAFTSITGGFTGAGSASTTLSWSGGDELRLNLAAKNNYATSSVQWQFEYSDDGTNWFTDGGVIGSASTTATTTISSDESVYTWNPAQAGVTTTRSWLIPIRNTKFLKISFRHSNASAVTSKIWAQIVKSEQQ